MNRGDLKANGLLQYSEGLRHRRYPGYRDTEQPLNTKGVPDLLGHEPLRNTFGVLLSRSFSRVAPAAQPFARVRKPFGLFKNQDDVKHLVHVLTPFCLW